MKKDIRVKRKKKKKGRRNVEKKIGNIWQDKVSQREEKRKGEVEFKEMEERKAEQKRREESKENFVKGHGMYGMRGRRAWKRQEKKV